jgi:PAS domain S-box-containing protein
MNSLKSLLVCLLFVSVIAVPPSLAQKNPKKLIPVTAVVLKNFPPAYYLEKENQPTGFAIDTLDRVAVSAGLQIKYVFKNNGGEAIEALLSGQADLCPFLAATPERRGKLDYTSSLILEQMGLIVRKSTQDIKDLPDLIHREVGVFKQSAAWEMLKVRNDLNLIEMERTDQALFALLAGQVDALAVPQHIFLSLARKAGVENRLKTVGKPLLEVSMVMAVRKGNTELWQRLEPAVRSFVASPEYRKVYSRWYGTPLPFWTPQRTMWTMSGILLTCLLTMALWRYATVTRMNRQLLASMEERRKAEKALQQSEERLRHLIESSNDWIWEVDRNGIYTYVSSRCLALLGYEPKEIIGKTPFDLMPPEEAFRVRSIFISYATKQEPFYQLENLNRHKDGRDVVLETNGVPILDEMGQFQGYRGMDRDITERKRAEEEQEKLTALLQQSQKMEAIGTLAGGIAHDFNNILTVIIGCTELTLMGVSEKDPSYHHLKQIQQAGSRATDLVKQILTFSRQGQQEEKLIQTRFIVQEAIKMLRASLPSTIEIQQQIGKDPGLIIADPTQIHQILMNLGTNAAHAMREKGGILEVRLNNVYVAAEEAGQYPDLTPGPYVDIVISDTGHGMGPEVLERIFDPYFTTKKLGEGTGLGLAVVYGIVKRYRGDIKVQSEPGKGSLFEIFLPRVEYTEDGSQTEELEQIKGGTERILLVDDEKELVYTFQTMLRGLGYQVTSRNDSLEALELFQIRSNDFDLIITDMTMPHMTGAEFSKRIRQTRFDIPILLCTGFSDLIDERKAKELGIQAFLMKPIGKRVLAETIRRLLDRENSSERPVI